MCLDFRNLDKPSLNNTHLLPKIDHTTQKLGVSNHVSLHDSILGYHQMIPLQNNQLKDFFKFAGRSFKFKPIFSNLKDTADTFQRTMFPVLNFFTMVYLDDIIICFKNDKEYLFYL